MQAQKIRILRWNELGEKARAQALDAVAATHRQYRRDLVPLRQAPVLYQRRTGTGN